MKSSWMLIGLLALVVGCDDNAPETPPNKENTEINERDADGTNPTSMDQTEDQKSIDLTAEIRSQVVELEDVSTNAHNVKIITQDGKVTLRGPVATQEEKDMIAKIATDVAGAGNVTNELEVSPE